MSFEIDDKNSERNSSNSMIVKDILNEFPFDKSEIKEDQKESGGIPLSRIVDLEKQEKLLPVLKCKICLNILLNPYDCSKCGNTFCYKCINKLKESMKKCPFGCIDYEIMPSSFAIKKFLEQLKFTCLNKENGCKEIISYNNLEQHDKNCNYIKAICPNSQCNTKIQWNLLNNHIQNECLYTLFECQKCHLKLNRKEYSAHIKICGIINKEFDRQSPITNKLTIDEINKNKEIFNNVMNSIENIPCLINENIDNNKDNNNNNNFNLYNNLNILFKSLIFCLSGKISILENEMNKINTTLKQFDENYLIFYQSVNNELDNINQKISILNPNENIVEKNKNNKKISINKCNSTYINDILELSSPVIQNNTKEHRKTIFPEATRNYININDNILLNTINKERQESVKGSDKIKTVFQKELSTSRKKKKINNKYDFFESSNSINNNININDIKDKNKNNTKRGTTINTLRTKDKFIKGMKSTKYVEKLKGVQQKKSNNNISKFEEKLTNDIIDTTSNSNNMINEQNKFSTINGPNHLVINNSIKEKLFGDKDKNNDNLIESIFNNQEIILKKMQNLESVVLNSGNIIKDNNISNHEFLSSFNSHKQSFVVHNNSMIPSESPKSNFQNNNS